MGGRSQVGIGKTAYNESFVNTIVLLLQTYHDVKKVWRVSGPKREVLVEIKHQSVQGNLPKRRQVRRLSFRCCAW